MMIKKILLALYFLFVVNACSEASTTTQTPTTTVLLPSGPEKFLDRGPWAVGVPVSYTHLPLPTKA